MQTLLALALALPLLGTGPLFPPSPPPNPPLTPDAPGTPDTPYESLLEAYSSAESAHRQAVRDAKNTKARAALRKQHPGYAYYPRFLALAKTTHPEAYLWLIANTRYSAAKSSAQRARQAEFARTLITEHIDAAWFEEAVPLIAKCRRALGDEHLRELLLTITETSTSDEVRAAAGYSLARSFLRSKDPELRTRGYAWYEKILSTWPDSEYAHLAEPEYNRARYLVVGGEPLDFDATTVDGNAFKLSDFRGKIVVLDFWGFW